MKKSSVRLMRLFPDKREKTFKEYIELKASLSSMTDEELDFEYGRTLAAYENKKGAWGLLWGTVIISILAGMWSSFFKIIQSFFMYAKADVSIDPVEAATTGTAIVLPVVIVITVFILILFRDSMKEAQKLKEKLVLIESIKAERINPKS